MGSGFSTQTDCYLPDKEVADICDSKYHSPLESQMPGVSQRSCVTSSQREGLQVGPKACHRQTSNNLIYRENNHPNSQEVVALSFSNNIQGATHVTSTQRTHLRTLSTNDKSNNSKKCTTSAGHGVNCILSGEQVTSPDSSLSTLAGFPTPCHLNLEDSDDSTLHTDIDSLSKLTKEHSFATPRPLHYKNATAPPLSPRGSGNQYGVRKASRYAWSSSSPDGDKKEDISKWKVHHYYQYAKSEKSFSEKKSH